MGDDIDGVVGRWSARVRSSGASDRVAVYRLAAAGCCSILLGSVFLTHI
jgi:hypothetical protein